MHDVVSEKHVEKTMIVKVKPVIHSPRHVQAFDCKRMNHVVSMEIVKEICVPLDSLQVHERLCVVHLEGEPTLAAQSRRTFVPITFPQESPVQPMIPMGIGYVKVVAV